MVPARSEAASAGGKRSFTKMRRSSGQLFILLFTVRGWLLAARRVTSLGSSCRALSSRITSQRLSEEVEEEEEEAEEEQKSRLPLGIGSDRIGSRAHVEVEERHCPPARPGSGTPVHVDVDPPPKTKPIFQVLSFVLIVLFSALQFLPPTHFRDPSDPFGGKWIPADRYHQRPTIGDPNTDINLDQSSGNRNIHIVSWINCLDLRVLAVLINSTLTSSRFPENIYFDFFLPGSREEKVSFYKLKVLFPDSNINIIGQQEIKREIAKSIPEVGTLWPIPPILAPFMVPRIKPSLRKFIYMPPDSIIKGSIDELFTTDMGHHAVAAGEGCGKRLSDHVSIGVVNAIQRTAAKDWLSKEPYDGNACMPDLTILLLDAKRLDAKLLEAILWWNAVIGTDLRLHLISDIGMLLTIGSFLPGGGLFYRNDDDLYPSVALSLSNTVSRLSPSWIRGASVGTHLGNDSRVLAFDGPRHHCQENREKGEIAAAFGNNWRQHISIQSEIILGH